MTESNRTPGRPLLLLATNNAGKVANFRQLLSDSNWNIVTPHERGLALDVAEIGATYAENALIKGRAFAAAAGLPALADDSGLEVDALHGGPGIYSARYGGPGLSDADRVHLLLSAIRDVPATERGARFRCVLVLVLPSGRYWQAEGVCEGALASAPAGAGGFGYDPIFVPREVGRTMAELTAEQKNRVSHRARAVLALSPRLEEARIGTRAEDEA